MSIKTTIPIMQRAVLDILGPARDPYKTSRVMGMIMGSWGTTVVIQLKKTLRYMK